MKPDTATLRYLLLTAAEFISKHAPEAVTQLSGDFFGTGDEPCTGRELSDLLHQEGQRIADQQSKSSDTLSIIGSVIQAGGEKDPTLTISTSQRELANCTFIPFFKKAEITITPL